MFLILFDFGQLEIEKCLTATKPIQKVKKTYIVSLTSILIFQNYYQLAIRFFNSSNSLVIPNCSKYILFVILYCLKNLVIVLPSLEFIFSASSFALIISKKYQD